MSSPSSKRSHGGSGDDSRRKLLRSWACGACTFTNRGSNSCCTMCLTNRRHHDEVAVVNGKQEPAVKQEPTHEEEEDRSTPVVVTPPRLCTIKQEPKDDNEEEAVSTEAAVTTTATGAAAALSTATNVKTEKDWQNHVAKTHRKYADRVLLARQAKDGIMKLGGGNVTMCLWPGIKNTNHPRYNAIGDKLAIWYNDKWQPYGPKYAGDPSGAVGTVHDETDRPFSVFMKRGDLGTEYCGDYKYAQDPDVANHRRASDVPDESKKKMLQDMLSSLKSGEGHWRGSLEYRKQEYNNQLANDPSPADIRDTASVAARLRTLNYHPQMSLDDMARNVVLEMNEFYSDLVIKFVEYDEKMYEYVKAGETTKTPTGKPRRGKNGKFIEPCAKASDWYNKLDQKVN